MDLMQGTHGVRMPDLKTRSERITLRITPGLREQLDRLAKEDRRKLGEYVYLLLEDHVKAKR